MLPGTSPLEVRKDRHADKPEDSIFYLVTKNEKQLLTTLLKSEAFKAICSSLYKQMSKEDPAAENIISFIFQILPFLSSFSLNSKLMVIPKHLEQQSKDNFRLFLLAACVNLTQLD